MKRFVKTKSKTNRFNIIKGTREIENYIQELPKENEIFKFISTGGFSTICFIKFISNIAKINSLCVSTLRVGKKELKMLDYLYKQNKIGKVSFIVGSLMSNDSVKVKKYGYYEDLEKVCKTNGWTVIPAKNHSKVLLFDTKEGKFVIETSSNLNENPKIEQFSFEKSEELYNFYKQIFDSAEKVKKWNVKLKILLTSKKNLYTS